MFRDELFKNERCTDELTVLIQYRTTRACAFLSMEYTADDKFHCVIIKINLPYSSSSVCFNVGVHRYAVSPKSISSYES